MFKRYLKTDIEQQVVSALLNNPSLAIENNIKEDYFLHNDNKNIVGAVLKLLQEQKPVSPMEICRQNKSIVLDYVLELFKIGYNFNIETHVNFLKKNSENLNGLLELKAIIDDAQTKDVDPYEEISKVLQERPIEEIKSDFKQNLIKSLDEKIKNGGKLKGLLSGIDELDEALNGFNKGRLYICGARSSMGKSAFMCSIAEQLSRTQKVGIISLEMTTEEMAQRIVCIRSKIPYWVIDKGRANDEQFDVFCETVKNLHNVIINDKGGLSCADLCYTIRQMAKSGCKIVFIDHLGLVKLSDSRLNLAYQIGQITMALKTIAKELEIPIVSLCQVNRGVEKQGDQRPRLSDLRDSGRIEEDADSVFFLYRPEYYTRDKAGRMEYAEILIAKNRNGECKTVKTTFDNQIMKWG